MPEKPFFNQELVAIIAAHHRLLIAGPIIAALAGYGFASLAPDRYISSALLKIDKSTANNAEAIMATPGSSFRLIDTDPHNVGAAPHLFRMEVERGSPQEAQQAATTLIDDWLKTTKPAASERALLDLRLEAARSAAKVRAKLAERLESESKTLVQTQGELATPIATLARQADEWRITALDLERQIAGLAPDVVVRAPSLPAKASGNGAIGKAALFGLASIPLLLTLLVLARFYRVRKF